MVEGAKGHEGDQMVDADGALPPDSGHLPRDPEDDYTEQLAEARRAFLRRRTGTDLTDVAHHSIAPAALRGNIEHFLGVAQVPVGVAGPLRINGEHARGEFYVPLATTEGTLVASYNRGMRLLTESGGVRTTVVAEAMQRSAVFVLDNALEARRFGEWVACHHEDLRAAAEATTRVGRLVHVGQYTIGPLQFLRLNYTTGDAAGQNMTGRATLAACTWIQEHYPGRAEFMLSGNIDTDKKHSQMNVIETRGRRVVAEAVVKRDLVRDIMRADTERLFWGRQLSNTGSFLAGSSNNGAHAANALAALFIATGQDAANVAESHAAVVYSQLLDTGDYYWSITLPALIVATHGGGTALPTQRACLELLGCHGSDKARKFAEICAAVVLAGETSLSCAVLAGEWVSSHERYGRNR